MLEDTSFSVTKRFLEQHGVDTNKSSEIAGAIYLLGGTPKDIYANKDAFVRFKNKPEYVYMDTVYTTHRRNKSLYNSFSYFMPFINEYVYIFKVVIY